MVLMPTGGRLHHASPLDDVSCLFMTIPTEASICMVVQVGNPCALHCQLPLWASWWWLYLH